MRFLSSFLRSLRGEEGTLVLRLEVNGVVVLVHGGITIHNNKLYYNPSIYLEWL